ncbi:MAG TPA: hypothetical protein PLG67_13480 [Bacillota bacterium]|nr:hypothetical protein [Bacillota bacterium]
MPDVRKFSDAEINRLVRFYEQAEREILDQLNRALLRGNKTEYLAQMKRNIEAILQQLREGNRTWCEQAIPRVYSQGLYSADAMLKDIGATVKAGFGAIHQQAAQVLAENAYQRFEDVVQVIGRQVNDIYRELALENVRGTVVGYDTWKQTARRYREQLAERGVTGFKDRSGRMWNMRTYCEMHARTVCMEAHLQGTANRLVEQGHDLVKVSTHLGACELCQPWQGKILSITGKTKGYPTLEEAKAAKLFHPRCRHAYGLHIDLEDEDKGTERKQELSPEEEKNYIEIEGLSKPAKTSLAKALTEALEHGLKTGTECLLHIDAKTGDSVYSRIEGTINEVVLPQSLIDFLDNAAPNSVIQVHNHPRSSCFSVDDIRNLVYYDSLKAISVIGHDGTRYVMSIGKGQRIDWSTLQKEYNTINEKHFDYFCNQVVSGKMTEQQAWKEHSHRIVMDLAEKYGWEYRRVMPNEK